MKTVSEKLAGNMGAIPIKYTPLKDIEELYELAVLHGIAIARGEFQGRTGQSRELQEKNQYKLLGKLKLLQEQNVGEKV